MRLACLVEHIPDGVSVFRMVDVPKCPRQLAILPHSPLHDDVTAGLVNFLQTKQKSVSYFTDKGGVSSDLYRLKNGFNSSITSLVQ